VGPAHDAGELLDLLRRYSPSGVVLDLGLPGLGGVGFLQKLREHAPDCVVVVLGNHAEPSLMERWLAAGADHFLVKHRDFERLPSVLGDCSARAGGPGSTSVGRRPTEDQ
jgi:DNA-binding NarL/FixJ family response regulator